MVHIYNRYSGGVDRRNALVSLHRAKMKRERWYESIFDRLFETCVANAYIIFKPILRQHLSVQRGIYKVGRLSSNELGFPSQPDEHPGKPLQRICIWNRFRAEARYVLEAKCREAFPNPRPRYIGVFWMRVKDEDLVRNSKIVNFLVSCKDCFIKRNDILGVCDKEINFKCERYH